MQGKRGGNADEVAHELLYQVKETNRRKAQKGKTKMNTLFKKGAMVALAFAGLMTVDANAQITLFELAVSTNNSTIQNQATDVSGVTGYTRGSGIGSASGGTFNSSGFDTTNASFADAITDLDVVTWNFTLSLAYNLNDFSVRYDRSGSGPNNLLLQLDTGSGFVDILTDTGVSTSSEEQLNISLASFTNVTSGTFRYVGFGATSSGGTFDFENTANINGASFQLTGTAVPEPTTFTLISLGLGTLMFIRRRRK